MARVVVVEDDEQVRGMLRETLERAGHDVSEAEDGNEALSQCRRAAPDVVITDIIMPRKEGIGTIIELKKNFPSVKIIAISGGGRVSADDYLNVASLLGADYAFGKPVDRKKLLLAVEQCLLRGESMS